MMTGLFFEEFQVGDHFAHKGQHTITEAENLAFCAMTENKQPLHVDKDFARQSAFGRRIVNGLLTMGLVVSLSVEELTEGTIVANLGYESIKHPKPVFHGDTINAVVVGGSVRDFLLRLPFKDYDIEVFGLETYGELEAILKPFGKVKTVGKSFSVMKLILEDMEVDFSFPRIETKTGKGYRIASE